ILFSQLLTWVCVGEESIDIIQGRYLIPIFPLLFMLLHNTKWTKPKGATLIVVVFSLLSLSYSSYVIFERYFVKDEVEKIMTLNCNAEEVIDINFLTDTSSVLLDNANTRSAEKSRSGKYSAKISLKNPYTFTYHLFNCRQGDSITIDVYRWGKEGGIIISDTENKFYTFVKDPVEKDSSGWEHLQSKFMVPQHMQEKEIRMFAFYPEGSDSSYFDDIKIVYRKLK
ncbi:MAG: hypothetical protein JWM14_1543, partial [Chitinophagaceae bacterium]|nr:hypothetical protein [Chitinophagaceae bacterium]